MALCLAFSSSHEAHAQSIRIHFEDVPLSEALNHLSTHQGLEFIYALRVIENKQVTCSYQGEKIDQALACVFSGTAIHPRRLHTKQYVLSPIRKAQPDLPTPSATPRSYAIQGYITDHATGKPLPGAHIFFPEVRRGTITDTYGFFSIDKLTASRYIGRISYLGYQAADTLLVAQNQPLTISLKPIALEADAIVIEAQNNNAASTPMPGVVSMNVQQLDDAPQFGGEKDLLQTLQLTTGVNKAGAFNNGLLVRGGFSDQNLYLIDGAPVYHPWHAFNLISTFHADAFEDIKFYKGAFPAQHGGRLSSVLDAHLKDGSSSGPSARLGMSVLSGRFLIESPLTKNSSFMISGRRSYIDKLIGSEHPVQDANGTRDTLRTGYHFSDITTKLSIRPGGKHQVSLSYYSGKDILDLRLPFNLSLDFNSWLRPAELFFEVDHHWGNRLYTFKHQYIGSERILWTNTIYRSSYNANESEFVQPTSSSSLRSAYHVRVRDVGIRSDLDYFISAEHHFQAGIHIVDHQFDSSIDASIYRSEGAQDSLIQASSLDAVEHAFYTQHTWNPTTQLSIQPGLRLSYFSSGSHLFLSPRLSVVHIVDPTYLIVKGSIGSQVQFIQRLRDRFSFMYDLVSSRWIPTSDELEPSRSLQVALEAKSNPLPHVEVTLETYWRTSKNVLIPRDVFQEKDGIDGPGISVSTLLSQYTPGLSRAYGVELSSSVDLDPWYITMSYSGTKTENRAPLLGDTRYHPSLFDVPRFFRGSFTRNFSDWHFTVSSLLRTGYPITVPVAAYTLGAPGEPEPTRYLYRPEYNNGRLPAYIRLDLTLGYTFDMLGADWSTQLHIFNVTNRRNIIDRYFEPTTAGVAITNRKGLPILPLFEIEMNL